MGKQFDELSKALASGISRREALRRFAGGILGGALAATVPGAAGAHKRGHDDDDRKKDKKHDDDDHKKDKKKGNSDCAKLCKELYPPGPERGTCISASTKCPPGQCAPFALNQAANICIPVENRCAVACAEVVASLGIGSYGDCINFAASCPEGQCPQFDPYQALICAPD